jgi:pectinesterase
LTFVFLLFPAVPSLTAEPRGCVISVENELTMARPAETVVLQGPALMRCLPGEDLRKIRVQEENSGRDLLTQAIDLNQDGKADELVFQADFRAQETRRFSLSAGPVPLPGRDDFKVYGRFVRERFDDFAWENDRIAHRMYGAALETWELEPLASSTVDIWCKRTRRLVINDWYLTDHYHEDTGEGADFYSAGKSRGCGGSGIWENGKLQASRNFTTSKVLANGPLRLIFELAYAPWSVGGREVAEVKRITLDAGQNLNRFESTYRVYQRGGGNSPLTVALGIKKSEGSTFQSDLAQGWLRTWEPVQKGQAGNVGCGIVVAPESMVEAREAEGNYLVIARADSQQKIVYRAGFGWDRSGDFSTEAAWAEYLQNAALKLNSPLKIQFP